MQHANAMLMPLDYRILVNASSYDCLVECRAVTVASVYLENLLWCFLMFFAKIFWLRCGWYQYLGKGSVSGLSWVQPLKHIPSDTFDLHQHGRIGCTTQASPHSWLIAGDKMGNPFALMSINVNSCTSNSHHVKIRASYHALSIFIQVRSVYSLLCLKNTFIRFIQIIIIYVGLDFSS